MPLRLRNPLLPAAIVLLLAFGAGCRTTPPEARPASRLEAAREALHGGEFASADQALSALAAEKAGTSEGHEALFLLGLLHLDPRNPSWSPREAEAVLARYLEFPFGEHRPEGVALYALARRLAQPQLSWGGGGAPSAAGGDGAAAGGTADGGEVERLRGEVAARDRELAKLREELERIRRRLTPP